MGGHPGCIGWTCSLPGGLFPGCIRPKFGEDSQGGGGGVKEVVGIGHILIDLIRWE